MHGQRCTYHRALANFAAGMQHPPNKQLTKLERWHAQASVGNAQRAMAKRYLCFSSVSSQFLIIIVHLPCVYVRRPNAAKTNAKALIGTLLTRTAPAMLARRLHTLACRSILHPSALHALASSLQHPPSDSQPTTLQYTHLPCNAWPPLHTVTRRGFAAPPSPPLKEMAERDILRRLAGFMLHDSGVELKMRLATAMGLLIASKAINVQVPFLFKYAVDALSVDPTGVTPTMLWGLALTPPAMVVAYGGARAAATCCNELRNAVFAKVTTVLDGTTRATFSFEQ